jgi:hypothetical protein
VERFAAIRALLDAGQARARVLAAHGLDDARWREEEEQVLSDLADAAEQADLEKLRSYQEAYRATWRTVVPADSELDGSETLEVEVSALGAALPFKKAQDVAAYRQGKATAIRCGNHLLAAQAEFGIAGVHFLGREYDKARASYRQIQTLAADMPPLVIEAVRMDGECHLAEGRPGDAITSLTEAIAVAEALPLEIRRTTSYAQAGKALAALLDQYGQHARARATEERLSMLATEGAAS